MQPPERTIGPVMLIFERFGPKFNSIILVPLPTYYDSWELDMGRVGLGHKILRLRWVGLGRVTRVQCQKYVINMQSICKKFVDY